MLCTSIRLSQMFKMWNRLFQVRQSVGRVSTVRCYSAPANKFVDLTTNENTGISTLTLQRPPVNSLNLELLQQISGALDEAKKNKSKGLILTSSSPAVFSAGLDILEMYKPNPDRLTTFWTQLQDTWLKLYTTSFPTVAVINGHSPAGGCVFSLACEYRIITGQKLTIGLNETRLGIIAPKWFMYAMINVIGTRQAEAALTTGKLFTSDEALKIGLVDELVNSKDEGLARADVFFNQFKGIPGLARKMTKLSFREELINWFAANKEDDLNMVLQFVSQPIVQQSLEVYMQSLKKK